MTYMITEWDGTAGCQIERPATPEEVAEIEARKAAAATPQPPEEVTAVGLRRALYRAGELTAMTAWLEAAEGEAADLLRIDWAIAQNIKRGDAIVTAYKEHFNKTEAEVDALLIAAASA